MKYALLLMVVGACIWMWQRSRTVGRQNKPHKSAVAGAASSQPTVQMISCSVCGLHLPGSEARTGKRGVYCSEAHQRQVGD